MTGLVCYAMTFAPSEKGHREYQHETSSGDEEWEVHTGVQVHAQVTQTGQGKVDHFSQQCPTTQVCRCGIETSWGWREGECMTVGLEHSG